MILAANQDKIADKRKRFLVKSWIKKTERTNGKVNSFLHWKFDRCNYLRLIDLLLNKATSMAEHSFMASWNYWQYKLARRNIIEGDLILVHDFAQNYLCKHQREVQGLHWCHEQVTVMPTVAHYVCSTCKGMVTHEIVHVSEDMKHDAHLVKVFTERSEKVLKDNKVPIRKIIEFTDQAPSQYKNKTTFNYLTKRTIPVLKNYFGVRHGKSSCDACTGRVKQGVTRLVQTEEVVVNSAKSFYDTCIKYLQKPKTHDCQHHVLTFEYHNKLKHRPNTLNLSTIPDTRKFHSIGNTKSADVYLRTFTCCCKGCLHGNEMCSNTVCPDQLKGYSLSGRKNCQPDRSWWSSTANDQIRKTTENVPVALQINWQNRIAALSAINTFEELVTYVNNNPLPSFTNELNDTVSQHEIHNLDMIALHHIPHDAPQRIAPISVEGDGNCFPRTISYLLYKTQNKYMEMRVRIVYEAITNMNAYLDNIYVSVGARNFYERGTLPGQYAMYSENYVPNDDNEVDVDDLYKKEVMDIRKDGALMGIWQVFQASNVVQHPIRSVFPHIGNPNVIKDMNRTVYCIDCQDNVKCSINIMWTPMQVKNSRPCHFVPLLKVVSASVQYVKYINLEFIRFYLILFMNLSFQTT